jgi:hypothetical protein
MYAERSYNNHIQVIEDIRTFGGDVDQKKLIGELSNIATSGHFNYLNELCNNTLHGYISNQRDLFNKEKEQAADPDELLEVVSKEQRLLAGLRKEHKHAMVHYTFKDHKISEAAKISYEQPTLLEDVQKIIVEARQEGFITNLEIMRTLKSTINIEDIHTTLDNLTVFQPRFNYLKYQGRKNFFNTCLDSFPYYYNTVPDYIKGQAYNNLWLDLALQYNYQISLHDFLYGRSLRSHLQGLVNIYKILNQWIRIHD